MTDPTHTPSLRDALAACPFCGGEARALTGPVPERWGTECNECDVWRDDRADTKADAIAAWNRRAARAASTPADDGPPCSRCGGPHPYDTSIPSEVWNRLEPDGGYLCLTCIVSDAVRAGVSFTAGLWGDGLDGAPITVTVGAPHEPADDAELAAIRERCAKATAGPWKVEDPLGPEILSIVSGGPEAYDWQHVAQVGIGELDDGGAKEAVANAAFIAHARQDVTALLSRLDAERSRADAAEARAERMARLTRAALEQQEPPHADH